MKELEFDFSIPSQILQDLKSNLMVRLVTRYIFTLSTSHLISSLANPFDHSLSCFHILDADPDL